MSSTRTSPESFLRLIQRARRGRLKIYLGHAPGVGKTCEMLLEGQQLRARGVDVVVGLVETHGRADTASFVLGLEVLPLREAGHRGVKLEELDVEAILARRPEVVLVDELAHANVPGSSNEKRWQDVLQLLEAGISVITTLNVQHLESLHDTVQRLLGVRVQERVPDWVLAQADQIVHVDLSAEDLRRRLEEGKVYGPERAQAALDSFFRKGNLEQLRQLTLREMASTIERKGRGEPGAERVEAPDQVAVLLSSRGPGAPALLRLASRLAGRLDRTWYALYVQTAAEDPARMPEVTRRQLAEALELARRLGATVFRFQGEDVLATVRHFVAEYRIGHLVVGRPTRRPLLARLLGRRSIVEDLVAGPRGLNVIVVDTVKQPRAAEDLRQTAAFAGESAAPQAPPASPDPRSLAQLVTADRVVFTEAPLDKAEFLARLASVAAPAAGLPAEEVLRLLLRREAEATTFLPEGLAVPHLRSPLVKEPVIVVGLPRGGLTDVGVDREVGLAFLLVLPESDPKLTLRLLADAARLFRDDRVVRQVRDSRSAQEVVAAIRATAAPSG